MSQRKISYVVIVALVIIGLFAVSQHMNITPSHASEDAGQSNAYVVQTTGVLETETNNTSANTATNKSALMLLSNPYQIADVAEAANPATVYIQVKWTKQDQSTRYSITDPFSYFWNFFWFQQVPQPREVVSQGSGFIIDESGIVLTNQHVVGNPGEGQQITVTVTSPTISGDFKARILGADSSLDLAVLQIEDAEGPFPTLTLGDSDKARQGEWVIAIGNPYGKQFDHTVTVGVLSAKGRQIQILDSDGNLKTYKNLMQIDAAINSGNSGGPLLNIEGEVIGINTAVHTEAQGIGFAIPINVAKEVLEDLINIGEVQIAWLGVYPDKIDETIMRRYRLPDTKGAFITDTIVGSPAAEAGLKAGDVIRRLDDHDIYTPNDLVEVLKKYKPGDTVVLTILRNNRTLLISVTLGNMPQSLREY